jgi:hypothetical protein
MPAPLVINPDLDEEMPLNLTGSMVDPQGKFFSLFFIFFPLRVQAIRERYIDIL